MCSGEIIRNKLGNPLKVIYSNDFCFEGEFTADEKLSYGRIKDEKGNLVYEGIIEYDIYQYFQKCAETGRIIKSKTL